MLRELLGIELLKARRSMALRATFATALLVAAVNVAMLLGQQELASISERHWRGFWFALGGQWCHAVLPVYGALIAALVNGIEHRNHAWRLMLALPVSQLQLFLAKALLAWLLVAGGTLALIAAAAAAVLIMGAAGAGFDGAFALPLWPLFGKAALFALPVVAVGHALSWRVRGMAVPMAAGMLASGAIAHIGMPAYWLWQPWTWAAMAALAGALLLVAGAALLARREVHA